MGNIVGIIISTVIICIGIVLITVGKLPGSTRW